MPPRPVPEPIAPGQESVWDYPRPPAIRAGDERIVIVLGGVEICAATTSWRMLETSHPPTYYLPRSAFRDGALVAAPGHSFCEWKGQASYLDVVGGDKVARRAGWYYPTRTARTRPCGGMLPCTRERWTAAWSTGRRSCRSRAGSTAAGSPQP